MQCTIRQRRHLECNSLRYAEPIKADERLGDVVTTSQVQIVSTTASAKFRNELKHTNYKKTKREL